MDSERDLPAQPGGGCRPCIYRNLCLPAGLSYQELSSIEAVLGCRRRVGRDDLLFRSGQPFGNLYAVRFGHFMTAGIDSRGLRYITGFQMAGELLGMEAIGPGAHGADAIALEDSEVCEIPYVRLRVVMMTYPRIMDRFHRALSNEIARGQDTARLMSTLNAEARLAGLLLNLSARYALRGCSARRFHLHMARADMAHYLGMTLETVSRLLARFRRQRLIALVRRDVEILDMAQLERVAAGTDAPL